MSEWTPPEVIGFCAPEEKSLQVIELFDSLRIPLLPSQPAQSWVLQFNQDVLTLIRPDKVSVRVDFTSGKAKHRSAEAGHGAGVLRKALGLATFQKRHDRLPIVVDATGGWGQDAWAVASLGCSITVIEQHPLVHALLENAIERAKNDSLTTETAERISLINADAQESLSHVSAEVIYLDPMYPQRQRKKADSKKGMQFLHTLLGPSDETRSEMLLKAALAGLALRVVVKRPKGADALEPPADWQGQRTTIESPNTRYDVYLPQQRD